MQTWKWGGFGLGWSGGKRKRADSRQPGSAVLLGVQPSKPLCAGGTSASHPPRQGSDRQGL